MDEGIHPCSSRMMYRILAVAGEVKERGHMASYIAYLKPEPCAAAPNQAWSWDITDLKGSVRGKWFRLDVCLDLFSPPRCGMCAGGTEGRGLARAFPQECFQRHGLQPGQTTLRTDRPAPGPPIPRVSSCRISPGESGERRPDIDRRSPGGIGHISAQAGLTTRPLRSPQGPKALSVDPARTVHELPSIQRTSRGLAIPRPPRLRT